MHFGDIGLAFNPVRSPAFQMIREVGFPLGVVVHPQHAFATRPYVKLNACANEPVIIPDRTMSLRDGIDRLAVAARVDFHPIIQATCPGIRKAMVAHRLGIGLLTKIDVVDEVEQGSVVFVPLSDRDLPVSYLLLMVPSNRYMTAAAALMTRALAEALDSLSVGGAT